MTKTQEIIEILLDNNQANFSLEDINQAARELGIIDYEQFKDIPIHINGRQVSKLKCAPNYIIDIKAKYSVIIIRVDDPNHPEFWLEISIPRIKIMHLLGGK